MVNVNVETVVIRMQRLLPITKLDELRLAHASRRHQADVLAVGEHLHDVFALLFPVAEILGWDFAVDDEWIRNHNASILRQRYENYLNCIIKLFKSHYVNCIKSQKVM